MRVEGDHFAIAAADHDQAVADRRAAAETGLDRLATPEQQDVAGLAGLHRLGIPEHVAGGGVDGEHLAVVVGDEQAITFDGDLLAQAELLAAVAEVAAPGLVHRDRAGDFGEFGRLQRGVLALAEPALDGAAAGGENQHQGDKQNAERHAVRPPAARSASRPRR